MSKKSEALSEAIVGMFMIALIVLLAYFTIVISGVDLIRGDRMVKIAIDFDQVGGLKDHDNVMYRGTKVGKVDRVDVTPSNLVVHASIDKDVILRKSCAMNVCNLSMLGGNYLLLEEGEGEILPLETTRFKGTTPNDWMRDVSKIAENVRALTEMSEMREIVTNVAQITRQAESFLGRATTVADSVEKAVGEAREFVTHAKRAADSILETAETAKDIAKKLDRDETFADLEAGIAAFRKAAESFDATETMKKANELIDNLNAVALSLKSGEGTLGKLAQDPAVYNHLLGILKDARQVLDNYRDTTPISTFSSLATGAL